MLITADRIKSLVSECRTEPEVVSVLRSHKIKYTFSTDSGYLAIRIPCRKGYIRLYRTASRSCPFLVRQDSPVPIQSIPVYHQYY
jgi:hypothetical protein